MPTGTGQNGLMFSSMVQTMVVSSDGGLATWMNTITTSSLRPDSVIQSWMCLNGAAPNGDNIYVIGNASPGPNVVASSLKQGAVTGKPFSLISGQGYQTIFNTLYAYSGNKKITQTMKTDDSGNYVQVVTVPIATTAVSSALLRGNTMVGTNGMAWYANAAPTDVVLDYYESDTFKIILDGALGMTATLSASAVALAVL